MAVWKKISNYDQSTDVFMSIQNNSLIPFSKVTIQFTTASAPVEGHGFVLTGPNQWSQRVPANTNVFYKEEDGGIATWWSRGIEKLVNYDIPTQEETVTTLSTKSVICPEGSFISIQNIGKAPIYYNMLGKANFVLTETQAISYTFSKDSVINFKSDGTGSMTYLIGQSPNVTMLSEETRKKLEDMMTTVDGLLEHAATKEELDVVKRRTYFGQWSPFLNVTGQSGTKIVSPVYIKDEIYHSEFLADKNILDIIIEMTCTRNDSERKVITEKGTIKVTLITQDRGDALDLASFYCDNNWLKWNMKSITLYRDNTNGQLKFEIDFNSRLESYTIVSSVRADNVKFVNSEHGEFLSQKIGIYKVDKDNSEIHFTDDTFYMGILKSWEFTLNPKVKKYDSFTKATSTSAGRNLQTFSCGGGDDASTIIYSEAQNGSDATMTVSIPALLGAKKVVGLNIKPNNSLGKTFVYLDLITMSNGSQNKTSHGNNYDFVIPLHRHTLHNYNYISDVLNVITPENMSDFYMEIVYE